MPLSVTNIQSVRPLSASRGMCGFSPLPAPAQASYALSLDGDDTVLWLAGVIDPVARQALTELLACLLDAAPGAVVADMSAVSHVVGPGHSPFESFGADRVMLRDPGRLTLPD